MTEKPMTSPSTQKSFLEKAIQGVSFIVGQIPTATTFISDLNLSLYQPAIYRGKEHFLILPVMVGIFAVWFSMRSDRAMYYLVGLFLMLVAIIYWIYEYFPSVSPLHGLNWLLYFCAFALLVAAAGRLAAEMLGIK